MGVEDHTPTSVRCEDNGMIYNRINTHKLKEDIDGLKEDSGDSNGIWIEELAYYNGGNCRVCHDRGGQSEFCVGKDVQSQFGMRWQTVFEQHAIGVSGSKWVGSESIVAIVRQVTLRQTTTQESPLIFCTRLQNPLKMGFAFELGMIVYYEEAEREDNSPFPNLFGSLLLKTIF